jgi:hypothetical protein
MNIRGLILSSTMLVTTADAAVVCETSDLAGRWWFTELLDIHDEEINESLFSIAPACRLIVDGDGEITDASCNQGEQGEFEEVFEAAFDGIRLELSRSCHINQCTEVGCLVGQMSRNKSTVSGVVFDGFSRGTFDMVKR